VDEVVINTGETPLNETHTIVTFVGNGTMTVPDTGKTFKQTNYGYAIISPLTGSPGLSVLMEEKLSYQKMMAILRHSHFTK
jgi:hypothetical protein